MPHTYSAIARFPSSSASQTTTGLLCALAPPEISDRGIRVSSLKIVHAGSVARAPRGFTGRMNRDDLTMQTDEDRARKGSRGGQIPLEDTVRPIFNAPPDPLCLFEGTEISWPAHHRYAIFSFLRYARYLRGTPN